MRRERPVAFDLKGARETRKLSQADVAAILCTTQASVSRWESSGGLPAVYRKAWDQHWKLEGLSNGKTNRATDKRVAGSARRSGTVASGKQGTKRSKELTRARTQARDTALPESVQPGKD